MCIIGEYTSTHTIGEAVCEHDIVLLTLLNLIKLLHHLLHHHYLLLLLLLDPQQHLSTGIV